MHIVWTAMLKFLHQPGSSGGGVREKRPRLAGRRRNGAGSKPRPRAGVAPPPPRHNTCLSV